MNNTTSTTATNFAQPTAFFTFKVYFKPGNQVRRLKFASNINFSEFKTIVSQLGQSVPQTEQTSSAQQFHTTTTTQPVIVVQYLDEENDWISVSSEEEWREALHQHSLLLSHQSIAQADNIFRIKFITLPKKPEVIPAATTSSSSSSTYPFSLPQSSSSLCRRETWEPYFEQVKESGKKMQPYLSQAKDMAVENAKKVQELVTDRQKQQDLKQWFRLWFEKLLREGQETQHKLGEWLKEFDNFVDSLSTPTTTVTAATTTSSAETTPWNSHGSPPPPYHFTSGGEEAINAEEGEDEYSSDDYVVVVNEPLLPESTPSQPPVWPTLPDHASIYPETTAPEHEEDNEEEHQLHQQQEQQQQEQENLESTIPQEFLTKLDSLLDMGFTDRELNLILLKQNKGDLVKVVSELLTASM